MIERSSNRWRALAVRVGLAAVLATACSPSSTRAQGFSATGHVVYGGGGASSNTEFAVQGTTGQPDAGSAVLSGGRYSVQGGFWVTALQMPGMPLLRIWHTVTNTFVVSWPASSIPINLVVQQSASLKNPVWTVPLRPIQNDGTNLFIVVSPAGLGRFYRLVKP